MFNYKYRIEFQNQKVIHLFGQDFFGDKKVFWDSHQTQLKDLYNYVLTTEFPFQIIDLETSVVLAIKTQNEFDVWITTTQPFKIVNNE